MSTTTAADEARYARFAAEKAARINTTQAFVKALDALAKYAPLTHEQRQTITFMETRFGAPGTDATYLRRYSFMVQAAQFSSPHTMAVEACTEARRAFWNALPSGKRDEIRDQLSMF